MVYITNFTNGYIVEYSKVCYDSWLLIPAENLWSAGLRGFLYTLAMFYLFLGIAIVADIFMGSIEVITSKKRKVTRYDPEKQESVEIEVFVWNETVANLTLMALGSSAPEILLAVIETIQDILSEGTKGTDKDGLGTFTIIGSASFNMLLITAICVVSVPSNTVKRVREFGVFILTAVWSMFAYVWLLITLKWVSPDEVEIWEAFLTLAFFPLLVLTSWCQDHGWWVRSAKVLTVEPPEVRLVGLNERRASHLMLHRSMELRVLEQHRASVSEHDLRELPKSRDKLREVVSLWKLKGQKPDANSNETAESLAFALKHIKEANTQPQNTTTTRLKFRHAALRSITRNKNMTKLKEKEDNESKKAMNVLAKSFICSKLTGTPQLDEALRKFNFSTQSYSVLKSAKHVDVDILLRTNKRRASRTNSPKSLPLPAPYDPSTTIDDIKCAKLNNINGNVITVNGGPPTVVNKKNSISKENIYTRPHSPSDTISEHSINEEHHQRDSVCSLSVGVTFSVDYETRDGSAKHSKHYTSVRGTMNFQPGATKHILRIPIVQHNDYTKDKEFFVILKNPTPANSVDLGEPSLTRVTIIDDDEPGEFLFEQASYHANFMTQDVTCTVIRRKGCDGSVTIRYYTMNGTATGGTEEQLEARECDFEHVSDGSLVFQHGETSKKLVFRINPACQNKNFIILLHDPSPGARIGEKSATVAHISSDVDDIVDRVANIITSEDEESLTKSWRSQFEDAIVIQGEEDEDGNIQPLTAMDFILHLLTLFWKVLFSFIPPRPVFGGWATFVVSLVFIAILTALVEQFGKLLGCVVGLKNSVTGITIIAIGTSLPDTFASKTAALQDSGADAAIGNITGSNSVNVFLGLGLPWVISVCYHAAMGTKFRVSSNNLFFSVLVYTSCGGCCLVILVLRRVFLKGELGGAPISKWTTSIFLVFLWLVYIVLSSLMAYGYIPGTV